MASHDHDDRTTSERRQHARNTLDLAGSSGSAVSGASRGDGYIGASGDLQLCGSSTESQPTTASSPPALRAYPIGTCAPDAMSGVSFSLGLHDRD
jgi:hypothetical protein